MQNSRFKLKSVEMLGTLQILNKYLCLLEVVILNLSKDFNAN